MNFARICRLLIDGGTLTLRNVFNNFHLPANLQADLSGWKLHLQYLRAERFLKPPQWKLLFPTSPACANSSNFDITLLVLLLRNICGLRNPAKGWDNLPLATDTNVQDDIARIKFYRNRIFAHVPKASLADLDFSNYWKEIWDALVRLGAKAADIDQLKDTSVDLDAERCIKALEQWCLHEQNIEEFKKLNTSMEGVKKDVTMLHGKMEEVLQEMKDQRTAPSSSEG